SRLLSSPPPRSPLFPYTTLFRSLAPYVNEETLERESKRIAAAMEMSLDMKIIHIHPYKNPLLFFGNAFDLSPRSLGKMLVEASLDRKSTRLNSSHVSISYAVFCL